MDNLSPDMEITITVGNLNKMIEKRANEIANEKLNCLHKDILEKKDHKNGDRYIITEEGNVVTEFSNANKAIIYLETKYTYTLSKASFINLKNRLLKEVKRETELDKTFRGKVIKIESISKNT
jgi:hypothetical protein